MNTIHLYFQYTHFSNLDLIKLRDMLSRFRCSVTVLSARDLSFISSNYVFGKLMRIDVNVNSYNDILINSILSAFPSLKLTFVYFNSFILTPHLFNQMFSKYNKYHNTFLFSLLSTSLNTLRIVSYLVKINLYNLLFRFKETYITRYSIKYIC